MPETTTTKAATFRPRTGSELKELDFILGMVKDDCVSLFEYLGQMKDADANELIGATDALRVMSELVADLRAHATASRRDSQPKAKKPVARPASVPR